MVNSIIKFAFSLMSLYADSLTTFSLSDFALFLSWNPNRFVIVGIQTKQHVKTTKKWDWFTIRIRNFLKTSKQIIPSVYFIIINLKDFSFSFFFFFSFSLVSRLFYFTFCCKPTEFAPPKKSACTSLAKLSYFEIKYVEALLKKYGRDVRVCCVCDLI